MNRTAIDALRVPLYSPSHPRRHMFRKINLIWELSGKIGPGEEFSLHVGDHGRPKLCASHVNVRLSNTS